MKLKTLHKTPHLAKSSTFSLLGSFSLIAFYASILLLAMRIASTIESDSETGGGILGSSLMPFIIAVGAEILVDKKFCQFLTKKATLSYFVVLVFYSLWGLIQGNEVSFLIGDIVVLVWPLGGVALFRLMLKSKRPTLHLFAFICLFTAVMNYSQIVTLETQISEILSSGRVINKAVYACSGLLLVPTAIAVGILFRKGVVYVTLLLAMVAIHFYNIVLLTATRSSAITLLVLMLFSSVGLSYKIKNGTLTTKQSFLSILIAMLGVVCSVLIVLTLIGNLFDNSTSLISDRGADDYTTVLRMLELADALDKLNAVEWIFGGGLGYAFYSIVENVGMVGALHIGIFTFLLKGGLIIFIPIAIFLYLILPTLFGIAWLNPRALDCNTRSATLIVLPGVFSLLVLLTLSGGFSTFTFLGAGFALGAFLEIQEEGLDKFFPSPRNQV